MAIVCPLVALVFAVAAVAAAVVVANALPAEVDVPDVLATVGPAGVAADAAAVMAAVASHCPLLCL